MSEPETSEAAPREVPVDWEALEDAFENNAPEVHSYLHVYSGEVLRVVDGIADPEMHSRIVSDSNYLRIESVSSREQYRWMERFIQMVDRSVLRESLVQAIDGKGAFRRFKDVLMNHATERERWFTFRSERLKVFMEAWLAAHQMVAVPRPVWATEQAPEPPTESEPPVSSTPAERRSRTTDSLRKALRELIDGLGTRDLEKVQAFAEFVKARRLAKIQASGEGSGVESASAQYASEVAAEAGEAVPPSEPRLVNISRS